MYQSSRETVKHKHARAEIEKEMKWIKVSVMEEINLWEGACDSERVHVQSCDESSGAGVERNSKPTILFVFSATEASSVCRSAFSES